MSERFSVFIYDDNPAVVSELAACIDDHMQRLGRQTDIKCFDDYDEAEKMLMGEGGACDVFFLDIELDKGKNGIEFADRMSRLFPKTKIVFVTGYTDKYSQAIFMQSPSLRPFGYVSKPIDKNVVQRILSLMIEENTAENENIIELCRKKQTISLDCSEILYVESYKRKLVFHLRSGEEVDVYGKISDAADKLPKSFASCHRSYIVNMDYIYKFDDLTGDVILVNGTRLCLGKTKRGSFMDEFFRYKGRI